MFVVITSNMKAALLALSLARSASRKLAPEIKFKAKFVDLIKCGVALLLHMLYSFPCLTRFRCRRPGLVAQLLGVNRKRFTFLRSSSASFNKLLISCWAAFGVLTPLDAKEDSISVL